MYKQSSEIFVLPDEKIPRFEYDCAQSAPKDVASRMSGHEDSRVGAVHLSSPIGGVANGIFRKHGNGVIEAGGGSLNRTVRGDHSLRRERVDCCSQSNCTGCETDEETKDHPCEGDERMSAERGILKKGTDGFIVEG